MKGFKSFGSRRVIIDLDKGLTVITGPNGSGKSNILDAVRFVLGDLSARNLRAEKMAGIIYDGVKETAATASVTVQLDNCERQIAIDTDTVTITRRVDQTGESEYSLNGRHVPRGQLVDILRMAGLSSSGYNIIMQGTITRLTDITSDERRDAIAELVGIAEYDAKKSEAHIQLQQADVNLRIASARIGDIQARLERLQEERDDALRHNFIQDELKKLQSIIISHKIVKSQVEKTSLINKFKEKAQEAENLKRQHDEFLDTRNRTEIERRTFDEEIVDKGNVRLVALQKTIGDLLSNTASLKMEIDSGETNLKNLQKILEDRRQHQEILKQSNKEAQKNLEHQRGEWEKLTKIYDEKNASYSSASSKLTELKQNFGKNTLELRKIENTLDQLKRQKLKFSVKLEGYEIRRRILEDSLKTLKERRVDFEETLKDLQTHFTKLQQFQENERESLKQLIETIDTNLTREEAHRAELDNAEETVKVASLTIVELKTQKTLAEQIATEENSLQKIEEMGRLGAISGILGRAETLFKVNPKFQKAMQVASAGWFKSLIVQDLKTALKCVESLKKMKLGRIRLIPLTEVKNLGVVEAPNVEGVIGLASSLIKCNEKYIPAVNFIFGDTIITSGEKSAFLTSRLGYRTIDINGDLFEAGGGLTGGYYREPVDIFSLIPSEKAMDDLSNSVKSLENLLKNKKNDIESIDADVNRLKEERIRRSEVANSIERELEILDQNISRARQNIDTLDKRISIFSRHTEKGEILQSKLKSEREGDRKRFFELASYRKEVKLLVKPEILEETEKNQLQLNIEMNDLQRQLTKIESEVNYLGSNIKNILSPELERVNSDIKTIEKQVVTLRDRIEQAKLNLEATNKQVTELEKSKEELSDALFSVKDRRREFEDKLDKIDEQIRRIDHEYNPLNNETHNLELTIQKNELDIKRLEEDLLRLGCKPTIEISDDEIKRAEASINLMNQELDHLGSVNQLAILQYQEQKDNYKQLSIRQNELEKEKRAIIEFIEEIERKKRDTFLQAFRSINENFENFFSKLTEGGKGYLSLQNSDDPFTGGIDIFAQFPGKASRLIAGASGGEKSVTAVSFIFSIQDFFQAPFYFLDEIDAHLDPYYAERLANLLKERSTYSQLIVLTLRDVIMDRADKLFGVYIQDGLSRIVSAKIVEVKA